MNIHPESRVREHAGLGRPARGDQDDEPEGFTFSALVWTVWENRWLLVATTAGALGIAAYGLHAETPLYTSTAQVLLETESQRVVDVESVVPQRTVNFLTINTELEVFRSQELMLGTVDALSLARDPEFNPALRPPPEWKETIGYDRIREAIGLEPEPEPTVPDAEKARDIAAGILRSKVSVATVPNTVIFNVSVETEGPEKSAAIANTIADLYVAGQRDEKFEAMEEAMGWLGNRVVELKAELEAAEAAVEDYAAGAALVSEETLTANTQRLKSMRTRQAELADEAGRLDRRIEGLAALRATGDFATLAEVVDDPRTRAAAAELAATPGAAGEAAAPVEGDPRLARFDLLFERWLDGLRAGAERAGSQVEAASRSVEELERQVASQSGDLVTLRQMQRETEATRLIYESFLTRLKEISVQQGIQQADSRVLSLASPGYRSHPKVQATLVKGGMTGLALGFLLISLRSVLRSSVRTPEELEAATGLTVIGVIPDDRVQRADRLIDRIVENSASGISEAVRNLRTAIQLSNIDETPQVVVVTSSVPDEGKSVLAAALAQTAAMPERKVLLIDADLRRRVLRSYLRAESQTGLISLLSGRTTLAETVQHDARTGLDFLIADEGKVTPADFFASQHFGDFIAEARRTYDLIVLDTPPVLAVPETRVIAQHADAVVYSVRWNSTTRRMIQTGLDLLRQVNVRVVGLALTRVDARRMDRYGYYGYGYGSRGRKLQKYYSG